MSFPYWNSDITRQSFYEARLASFLWSWWYGNIEIRAARGDSSKAGTMLPDWQDMAAYHAKRGLFALFNSRCTNRISKAAHDKLVEHMGPRFLGHDEGEWDGAYMGMIAGGNSPHQIMMGVDGVADTAAAADDLDPGRSRGEACQQYLAWLRESYARHHGRMVSVNSLCFGSHYAAESGTRMLGIEPGESLPCDNLLMMFCRGASKQYDLLFQTVPAVYSIRGLKLYPLQHQPQSMELNGIACGPEHGTTLGLLKRLWWLSYMSGASMVGLQLGYFPTNIAMNDPVTTCDGAAMTEPVTDAKVRAHLTPVGWLLYESRQAAKQHPLRGTSYVPMAVMLHHDHGWYPQPNLYTGQSAGCVWGNIPYNAGDWQTEKFFEWVLPGYKLAASYRDERGKMVNTPLGDSFDAIVSSATSECLNKYQAVVLLGSWDVAEQPGLAQRLEEFVEGGGTVITDVSQWPGLCQELAGSTPLPDQAGAGELVRIYTKGRGRIVVVSAPAWGADQEDKTTWRSVTGALADVLTDFLLIEIEGRPVGYLVNVTDQPDELLITLFNNSHGVQWDGTVRVKGQEIVEVEEWLAHGECDLPGGALRCAVPANDVRIYRVRTARAFLPLQHTDIPWQSLGVGAAEEL